MRTGTRRMWSRRVLRAGWLIASISTWPRRAYTHFFCDAQNKFQFIQLVGTLFLLGVICAMTSCSVAMARKNITATAKQITTAVQNDACMIDLVPRRAAHLNGNPMSLYDLDEAIRDCDASMRRFNALAEQKKAMTAITGGKK